MKLKIKEFKSFNRRIESKNKNQINPGNQFQEFEKKEIQQSIVSRFESQVKKYPDKVAVVLKHHSISYQCINEYSNRLAQQVMKVKKKKCDEEQSLNQSMYTKLKQSQRTVGLLFGQSIEMLIGIMGVLKANDIYIPLDPNYPSHRLEYMLQDTSTQLLVVDIAFKSQALTLKKNIKRNINILVLQEFLSNPDIFVANVDNNIQPENMAYILYTSGSTGRPKGVVQNHRNVLHFARVYTNALHIEKEDRLTLFSSYSFDAAKMDIFGALLNGASLFPFDIKGENNLSFLVEWLQQQKISIFHSIPTLYRYITNVLTGKESFPYIRFIVLGGEAVLRKDVEQYNRFFSENCIFINGLGPTESTVTLQQFLNKQNNIPRSAVPVGFPVDETEVILLNEKNQQARLFETGEIIFQSQYLALGYLNNQQATNEVFIKNPINGKGRVYRSGDMGRQLRDGSIEYVGRKDFQVKMSGYRIELNEIESQLDQSQGIKKSVIVCHKNSHGENQLIAFYVEKQGFEIDEKSIMNLLKKQLPHYMIPGQFYRIQEFPYTPTGKIDRKVLTRNMAVQSNTRSSITLPRNETEKKLAKIWSLILSTEIDTIGIDDDFFTLGGNSIRAILMTTHIHKEFNVNITLRELFQFPSLWELAEKINSAQKEIYHSIQAIEKQEYYPLSSSQERLYVLHQLVNQETAYNLPYCFPIYSEVNMTIIEDSFKKLINRHESLRSSFFLINEQPFQKVHSHFDFKIEYIRENIVSKDREWGESEKNENFESIQGNFKRLCQPFDLTKAPLIRVILVDPGTGGNQKYLFIDMHHIITDARSQMILRQEFIEIYNQKALSPLRLHYKDFSQWQNHSKQTQWLKKQEKFWIDRFSDDLPILCLPIDFKRPAIQDFKGNSVDFYLNEQETLELKNLVKESNVTLYMGILAVFSIFLNKVSGEEDIIIGTPIAGRSHIDLESIIGMFVNTLAMRNNISNDKTLKEFLEELKIETLTAFENQSYPFEDLVDTVNVPRDTGRNPLFDVMFNLLERQEIEGSKLESFQCNDNKNVKESFIELKEDNEMLRLQYNHYPSGSKFDLSLTVFDGGSQLYFTFEYSTSLFKSLTIERFIGYFYHVIYIFSVNPDIKISEIDILGYDERKKILEICNGIDEECQLQGSLLSYFQEQVKINQNHMALVFNNYHLTYEELESQSKFIYQNLKDRGTSRDGVVGLMVNPSIEMIIAIIAILKSGAAYLPIVIDYPKERKEYMIQDSNIQILLSDTDELEINNISTLVVNINHYLDGMNNHNQLNKKNCTADTQVIPGQQSTSIGSYNLAYVIYTSGSTGKPKGVLQEQRTLINLIKYQQNHTNIDFYRVLQFNSIGFDVSAQEVFSTLLSGGTLILISKDTKQEIHDLFIMIQQELVQTIFFPTSFLRFLSSEKEYTELIPKSVKHIVTAGEQLFINDKLKNKLNNNDIQLHNHYGPTEAHVVSTLTLEPDKPSPHRPGIGKPVMNTSIYILDKSNHLCPIGIAGEMYLEGIQVARGYLNNPELTDIKFCLRRPETFLKKAPGRGCQPLWTSKNFLLKQKLLQGVQGGSFLEKRPPARRRQRIYKTGDLGRWLENKEIEFLGRVDTQLKLRGFRVELGEIEHLLRSHPQVKDSLVIYNRSSNGDGFLCGYIIPSNPGEKLESQLLIEYLLQKLPEYMIPKYFISIEAFPLTTNGKINLRVLPGPIVDSDRHYIPPGNEIETKLVEIWTDVLGFKGLMESPLIGMGDSFFALGGHSLRATVMVSKINKIFGIQIPLAEIFHNPTIPAIARYIKNKRITEYPKIHNVEKKEYYPLSPAQKRLYSIHQMKHENLAYNMLYIIELGGHIHVQDIEKTFKILIARHESLRTYFKIIKESQIVQQISPYKEINSDLKEYRVNETGNGSHDKLTDCIKDFLQPFDLSIAPLLRVGIIDTGDKKKFLLFDMHHINSDGVSMEILRKEFMNLFEGKQLPKLRVQYKEYIEWQCQAEFLDLIENQKNYWLELFSDQIPILDIPMDFPRPAIQNFEGESIDFTWESSITKHIHKLVNKHNYSSFIIILTLFYVFLSKISNMQDIVVGTPIAGRKFEEFQGVIGFFVNSLALRNYPGEEKYFIDFLTEVRLRTISAYDNQDYPFDQLVDQLLNKREAGRNPLFDIMFAFHNQTETIHSESDQKEMPSNDKANFQFRRKRSLFDIVLHGYENRNQIYFSFEYNSNLFKRETINRFIQYFNDIAYSLLEEKNQQLKDVKISLDLLYPTSQPPDFEIDI